MLLFKLFLDNLTNLEETLIVHIDTSLINSNFSSKDEIFKNLNINEIIFNINQIIKEKVFIKFKKISQSQIIINNEQFINDIYIYPKLNLKSFNNIDCIFIKYIIPKSNDLSINYPNDGFIISCYDAITYLINNLYDKKIINENTINIYNTFTNDNFYNEYSFYKDYIPDNNLE